MGINKPTGELHRLEELDKMSEGRWTLIHRPFEDVEALGGEGDRLAGAHATRAGIKMVRDWDWDGAESELLRAIELNPADVSTRQRLEMLRR